MGRMKQNDPFLPYTINPIYSDLPLPRESLDGKVDTTTYNFAGKLYARINNKFSFTARGKWDKRDNKTPVDLYTPVVTDLLPIGPRYNRPYSYKRQQYSADLRYRFDRIISLSGGVRQYNMDRTCRRLTVPRNPPGGARSRSTRPINQRSGSRGNGGPRYLRLCATG